jgi:transposase InsO family protein
MVETANGGLVEVTQKGTVKVLLQDAFEHNRKIMVYLNDVLYVPLLSRRLFSVAEWNQCGGTINFMMDRCRIEILDDDDKVVNTVDVDPIYAEEAVNDQRVHSVAAIPDTNKRTLVPQTLLHQRLGHRNTSTLLMAHEDGIWADTAIARDEDYFCETCRITTARKANRGHTPLETMDDLIPGSFVMVDIVTNPATSSITAASFFPYYLAITDVTSRLFVPLGIKDKTADSVFRALQEWATYYGPATEFNLFMLTHIHGDFDSAFTSATLREFARAYNIRITFAAPRSQHQNGIHESNWKNIRNLAFAMMTQARVPMKFFHFALEHAWKLHSVLPHRSLTKTDVHSASTSAKRYISKTSVCFFVPC